MDSKENTHYDDRYEERNLMVEFQIIRRGITDKAVIEAMREVPRHLFVPENKRSDAYLDTPLLIGEKQTISQPYMVALMAQALEPNKQETVLEIGTGSGYSAAVLSKVFTNVFSVERHDMLAQEAKKTFNLLSYKNINVRVGDGTQGWPEAAPFDAIIVTAGGPKIPKAFYNQLKIGGRLVIPVGEQPTHQNLLRIRRKAEDSFIEENLGEVKFVPLIGEEGW